MSRFLLFAGLGLFPTPVAAAVVAIPATDPAAIVVTGRGLRPSAGDIAYDVVTIDRQRLLESASGRLEDALRDVAGLQGFRRSDSRSANATSQSLTLRGLGGNASSRALLILDGVPQTDPFGGWISFPAYSTDRLASVRVTRGGGSGIWGPGALAGTVELDSAGFADLSRADGMVAYGSRNSLDARGSAVLGSASAYLVVGGAYARGDGFIPIVPEDRGPIDRPARYDQWSAAARAVIAVGSDSELQASLSGFRDARDRGLPNTDNRGKGVDASLRLVGKGSTAWSLLGYYQKHEFASQSASVNAARTLATLTNNQYSVPSRGWGGRAEIVPLSGPVTLELGADARRVRGETNELLTFVSGNPTRRRTAGGRSLTLGLFADATLTRGRLTANLSGRIDRWTITHGRFVERTIAGATVTDTPFADRHGWEPTGRAAVAIRTGGGVTVRAAAYRGWRLPTLNELYRPFRVGADATAANPLLKPETSVGIDGGIDVALTDGLKASATAFVERLDDAIANVTIARGPGTFPGVGFVSAAGSYRRRENLDHIGSRGLELGLDAHRGPFSAHLSYALVDARVHSSGIATPLNGLRPAQVARHNAAATIGWSGWHGIDLSLTGRAVSAQFDDDQNLRKLKGALTLDGHAAIALTHRLSLDLRAENIFDRRIETALSGDGILEIAAPRTLWIGLRLK